MRDNFSNDVKDLLARRAGMKCSNPNCRQPTSGPQEDPEKVVNVGVAAHICAASPGGPRFDPNMTSEERSSSSNGIWLCQTHAKLVDNDEQRYTVELLRRWKRLSEEAALLAIESSGGDEVDGDPSDADMIRFYAQCFDRPAFQDPFMQEGSIEAFDKAIEDTITAINTGCLRSRDGAILSRSRGKAFLRNAEWRNKLDVVVDLLRAVRSRYDDGRRQGIIHVNESPEGRGFYCINDREFAHWMDSTRGQAIETFNELCQEAGVPPLIFPRHRWGR